LDISDWKGTYQDVLTWPANTTDETKALVTQLVQNMETATIAQIEEIKKTLTSLPMPYPGYHLLLQRQQEQVNIDLWDLCYQVCFLNYSSQNTAVDIDTNLIDEYGDVNWQYLENKTQELVKQVFANLPILSE
jgi:hypothetical protein